MTEFDIARKRAAHWRASIVQMLFSALRWLPEGYSNVAKRFGRLMPKGLYARSLIIIIAPVIVLQAVVAYFFMERHWRSVTGRLSRAVASDIAMLVDVYESDPRPNAGAIVSRIARTRLGLDVTFLPEEPLPPANQPKLFFGFLDQTLSKALVRHVHRPFWIDTVANARQIEIRVDLDTAVMRVLTRRSQAYASNAHIFLVWMVGSSLVLIAIAVLFLRNQIRPILRLSAAAESFGKGREIDFRPRGAREVRQAGHAFIEMKRRIERAMEQRTAMLNGVSHDLRTILTRFRLSVEMMSEGPETELLRKDVHEMSRMLEGYLSFARGDGAESAVETNIATMLDELKEEAARRGARINVMMAGEPVVLIRPHAFKRLLSNLINNAIRFAANITVTATHDARWLSVMIDDDGPGISPSDRDEVFKPFVRLDEARNQDESGTGLGLAIARDISRNHGGEITLQSSPLGGLRAAVRIPA